MSTHRCGVRGSAAGMRPGFTVVELTFVLMIGGILMGLAIPSFKEYAQRREVLNARSAVTYAAARARSSAVERGEVIVLMIRPYRDSVFVMTRDWKDTLEMIDFVSGETRSDIIVGSGPAPFRVCYMPSGFAHPSCEHGEYLPKRLGFTSRNGTTDIAWAVINAVGQVEPQ